MLTGLKLEHLTEKTASAWRNVLNETLETQFQGRHKFYIPTALMFKTRKSVDGVHYELFTYQALVERILRGVSN